MRQTLAFASSFVIAFAFGLERTVQAQEAAPSPSAEVIIVAPYLVHKKEATGANLSTKVMEISAERHVSYEDLDPGNPADAAKLEQRINEAATEACAQLDREYPPQVYVPVADARGCVKSATDQAMATVREIIDGSKKPG